MDVHDEEKDHLSNLKQSFSFLCKVELRNKFWNSNQSLDFQESKKLSSTDDLLVCNTDKHRYLI